MISRLDLGNPYSFLFVWLAEASNRIPAAYRMPAAYTEGLYELFSQMKDYDEPLILIIVGNTQLIWGEDNPTASVTMEPYLY